MDQLYFVPQHCIELYEMEKDLPILLFGNKHDLLFKGTIMSNQKREVIFGN
jgi:hypothetical protein